MNMVNLKFKKFVEGVDYYLDPESGKLVWTSTYLLNRGYCCNHDCRHCPYKDSSTKERIDIVYEKKRIDSSQVRKIDDE